MPSEFQKMLEDDIRDVFLNLDEFAARHNVEGREITIVMAPNQQLSMSGGYTLGVSESSISVHVAAADLPQRKEAGETLNIDGREYIIDQWNEHQGMAEIMLSQTRTA
jgi:hypothetical protein